MNIISLVISSVYDGMDAVKHRLPDGRGSEKGTPLPNRDRKGAGAFWFLQTSSSPNINALLRYSLYGRVCANRVRVVRL